MALNESGQIEMEERSQGETLEEKLEDFDEVIPDITESEVDPDEQHSKVSNGHGPHREKEVVSEDDVEMEGNNNPHDESPISNGHSIVTEATIEAHDVTDLESSAIVSSVLLFFCDLRTYCSCRLINGP